jgi:hypothetical protein
MARPSKALQRFVELYVNGPAHVQGQWNVCANAAGMREPPERADPMVRRMVEEAGGVVAESDPPPRTALDPLERVLGRVDEGIPWKVIRADLADVIRSVANGEVQARAAQVAMLKYVIEKAEKEAETEEQVHSVIVLPVVGLNAELRIDEQWMAKIKSMETPADE